jgi:predicted amidohydrolase
MEVGGFRVVPVPLATGPLPDGRPKFGAALFRNASLKLQRLEDDPSRKRFRASGFAAADLPGTLSRQATAAFADGCLVAVWPELTMTPESRQALSDQMAMEAMRHGSEHPLRLVVAGSWHEPQEDGGVSNVCHILGRTGDELCAYAKFAAFHDEEWGEEAIARGDELPIVVMRDLVVGFAICKDFCDRAVASPFADLPVDLMLVPSMGGASTMGGHLTNAEDLRLRTGTLVFVVQQSTVAATSAGSGAELGQVLLSQSRARAVPQDDIWAVHQTPVARQAGSSSGRRGSRGR